MVFKRAVKQLISMLLLTICKHFISCAFPKNLFLREDPVLRVTSWAFFGIGFSRMIMYCIRKVTLVSLNSSSLIKLHLFFIFCLKLKIRRICNKWLILVICWRVFSLLSQAISRNFKSRAINRSRKNCCF